MNEQLRAAVEALASAASDVARLRSESAIRDRLRQAAREILLRLEAEEEPMQDEAEVLWDDLRRKSLDIAEDLRRAERLMRGDGR